jgi:CRP-like cAMP-binding protein
VQDCAPHFCCALKGQEAAISLLARVHGFERLDKGELDQLEALTEKKRYPAGTAVFFQDDPSDAFYILVSGSAKAFQTSETGQDRILRILKPGNAFGDLAMIADKPRFLSVQTLEDCEILRLSRKDFVAFADKHTWVLWTLLTAYAERIRGKNEELLDLSFRDLPYRLLHTINELVERHGEKSPEGLRIGISLSANELASIVGATPESVGRLLERFENDGLIKHSGSHWIVPDPNSLTRTLEYVAQQGA